MFLKTAWPPLVTRDLAGVSPPVLPPLMIRQRSSISTLCTVQSRALELAQILLPHPCNLITWSFAHNNEASRLRALPVAVVLWNSDLGAQMS